MPEYIAKNINPHDLLGEITTYNTDQYDLWDIVSYRVYGDERAMHWLIDDNWDARLKLGWIKFDDDFFPADVTLNIPQKVRVIVDLKPNVKIPEISKLLPWR